MLTEKRFADLMAGAAEERRRCFSDIHHREAERVERDYWDHVAKAAKTLPPKEKPHADCLECGRPGGPGMWSECFTVCEECHAKTLPPTTEEGK